MDRQFSRPVLAKPGDLAFGIVRGLEQLFDHVAIMNRRSQPPAKVGFAA